MANSNKGNCIDYERFRNGWTFFVFTLSPSEEDLDGFELSRQGTTSIHVKFSKPVPSPGIEMLVYGNFDGVVSITHSRKERSSASPTSRLRSVSIAAIRVAGKTEGFSTMNTQELQFRNVPGKAERHCLPTAARSGSGRPPWLRPREAEAVDREARFPRKAIDATRKERLLGAQIPVEFGGDGASISEVADICYALGRACASTAMIFAMHQIKVACVVRHGIGSAWHERLHAPRWPPNSCCSPPRPPKARTAATSAPARRRSSATGAGSRSTRAATVISYGAEADGIVTTARRADGAAGSDQVLVAILEGRLHAGATSHGTRSACAAPAAPASR